MLEVEKKCGNKVLKVHQLKHKWLLQKEAVEEKRGELNMNDEELALSISIMTYGYASITGIK